MNDEVNNFSFLSQVDGLVKSIKRHEYYLKEAVKYTHGTHTFDDVVAMIITGRVQFFAFDTAFVIMEVIQYPQFQIYHCFLAGGDMDGVLKSIPLMKLEAERRGCRYLSMAGRKGWEKVLSDQGWQHVATTMYTEIN